MGGCIDIFHRFSQESCVIGADDTNLSHTSCGCLNWRSRNSSKCCIFVLKGGMGYLISLLVRKQVAF